MRTAYPPHLDSALLAGITGSVAQTIGLTAAVADFPVPIGAVVNIEKQSGDAVEAEVIGFRDKHTLVMPLSRMEGIRRGSSVRLVRTSHTLRVGNDLLGRVVDARGQCIDGRPQPMLQERRSLEGEPLPATERPRIDAPLATGVRAIDGLLTCGRGQRLGIFAGSGIGKSVLMGMMGRYTDAEVAVIGLIGERGREVNEFIHRELGPAGLARSVVVVATSNDPALLRVQAASTATTIAEYFRDAGKNVLLIMDSVTRFALAQREIGLSAGEPPTTRGFPPSVFSMLPRLVERAGRTKRGSITAFYSVLVEGDDENEPIADTMRGLLDGHVWLSRRLAERGHFPAIDILRSISRLMTEITPREYQLSVRVLRQLLSVLHENEDLLSIGAYRKGTNRELDVAVAMKKEIHDLLRQAVDTQQPLAEVQAAVSTLAQACSNHLQATTVSPQV
ncbi:FliI/YscN family ATPase [Bythopirellula polymerisocia]|uniref:Flagellum-specific ATP synthase n=1 Tax=Bythopirellula polymerisocia TaxID=2528003 RepID=A0A5C6CWK6_9BACT|nr:FliI/YscN family ATPase [Bythopirellula polymerisocia]TWU27801.1 Flagellum-specific ATP synthase [Bythopirellula polymerisocia]